MGSRGHRPQSVGGEGKRLPGAPRSALLPRLVWGGPLALAEGRRRGQLRVESLSDRRQAARLGSRISRISRTGLSHLRQLFLVNKAVPKILQRHAKVAQVLSESAVGFVEID